MFQSLYQYLILHGKLVLPEVGVIVLETESAVLDTANKLIVNPEYHFNFQEKKESIDRNFFAWLAKSLNINDTEAIVQLTDFCFEFKNKLNRGEEVIWNGVGVFKSDGKTGILFEPEKKKFSFFKPVFAEKVIREKPSHKIRVGEDEKSSEEMEEFFSTKEKKKLGWWPYAMTACIAAFIFIVFHLTQNNLNGSSTGNQQNVNAKDIPEILK